MKKNLTNLALLSMFCAFSLSSCKSNSDKEAEAQEKVTKATEDLNDTKEEVSNDKIAKANDADWQTFKTEVNTTIAANEARIVELNNVIKKSPSKYDDSYKKSISDLEKKNNALKERITNYENNQTDWPAFKQEFNADMTALGKTLKDMTVKNKK